MGRFALLAHRLFPCPWFRCIGTFGCRCGVGGRAGRKKEAKHQEDIARQTESAQNEQNQFLAQLVPGSAEFNEFQAQSQALISRVAEEGDQAAQIRDLGTRLVAQQQARADRGESITPFERRTELAFGGIREAAAFTPEEQDILNVLRGQASTTPTGRLLAESFGLSPEQQATLGALRGKAPTMPLGRALTQVVERAGEPERFFEATLEPQLALLRDAVNREAIRRGEAVQAGGIPLERLGRTGVELAIQQARERENFRQTQLGNLERLANVGLAIPREQLANLLTTQQLGQQFRGRQIGVEEAFKNLQAGRESRLTDLLASQTGRATENLLELLGSRTTRAENLRDVASALREAKRQRTEELIGTVLVGSEIFQPSQRAAFGNVPTTPSQAAFPTTTTPTTAQGLLASQQQQAAQTGLPLATGLSRKTPGQMSNEEFARLLRLLQASGGGF